MSAASLPPPSSSPSARSPRAIAAVLAADPSALRRALLSGEAPDGVDERGKTPLLLLAESWLEDGIRLERAQGVYSEDRSVAKARCAKALLEFGARPELMGPGGDSPLHIACSILDPRLSWLFVPSAKKLDLANAHGLSPLLLACSLGRSRCALLLLEAGADPNFAGPDGETPLGHAAASQAFFLAETLIFHLADASKLNGSGLAPWEISSKISGPDSSLSQLLFHAFMADEQTHLNRQIAPGPMGGPRRSL